MITVNPSNPAWGELDNLHYLISGGVCNSNFAFSLDNREYVLDLTNKVEGLLSNRKFVIIHHSLGTMYVKKPYKGWSILNNSQSELIRSRYGYKLQENEFLIKCKNETDYLLLKAIL